ncbi:hypothetical protein [Streptomyces sp. NBC_00690]|uniref:hypothetical protein n=1 Tax=Streptomyces sp. NBC_00690 TaxID=2975808 RepID=UPI002E2A5723|nr:hypothetical protein [Streptomyces sp. NBC_00690]
MYGGHLAHTGTTVVAIGGLTVGAGWIVALAALMVVIGAVLVRFGFQRRTFQP